MLEKDASLEGLEIGALNASEVQEAMNVIVRGMRDNPLHVAAFGDDPEIRQRKLHALMSAEFTLGHRFSNTLAARREDGRIVGVCGVIPPGECRPGLRPRLLPTLLRLGPRSAGRVVRWLGLWGKHDPKERHWHVGVLAVDQHLQGMGIGSKLIRVFCAQMDAAGEDAYLQTDKPANIHFFEIFGFAVVGVEEACGVPNWFMLRRSKRRSRIV